MLKPLDLGRINRILFFIILVSVILYFGREFFVILTFAGFLAMLMAPVAAKLEEKGVSRVLTSLISVLIILAVIFGAIMLLSAQIVSVREEIPRIKSSIGQIIQTMQVWTEENFGISLQQQIGAMKEKSSGFVSGAGNLLTGMVKGTFTFLGSFTLVIVFTFLFLLHREKYGHFVIMLYRPEKRDEAEVMMKKISKVAQQYLVGRLISMFILAVLYVIGFTIVGLENATLLSVIAAIFTFIPYVGPVLGGLVPFIMAILGNQVNDGIWVVVILTLAQLFDNYFVEPYVVGGSVNIGPFFAIFILILGGVVWGIAGVILFLPLLGILKIVFESIEGLQPYAYLIGDQKESSAKSKIWSGFKHLFKEKEK
jgi:predicted PurR-regulated permease PerM